MKSPLSPERIRGSIEPLEARIAPATLYVGDPNFSNNLDTEYIELSPHAGQTLFFVNTSKASINPQTNPEGDPVLAADDVISQAVDGTGVGTYYLRLTKGDVVFRFTDNGYKELVRVKLGSAIAFFTDYNHNIEYDDGEFSGLSLGPNASVLVSEKLFGDAVTNLNIGKLKASTLSASRDDTLDMTGLVNFRQGIKSLAIEGGSIFSGDTSHFGKVLSGGTIQRLVIGGNVDGVYAGTAALGKTYDFFPGVPGGEGMVTNYSVPKGIAGASILNAKVLRVNDGLFAGDGGFGASGGALNNIQITQDTDGLILKSGNGGDADLATRAINGGAGGAIRNVFIGGLLDSTPNSAVLTQKIQILAGDGGLGLANTRGGAGGSAMHVFIGFEVNGSTLIDSVDLLRDTVFLQGGAGGDGARGGIGGAIISSKIRVQTPDATGDEISIIGGKGGDSLSTSGVAGRGGTILNVDARNRELTYDSGLLVQAGDAGTITGLGFGANGGNLTNVTLQGFDLQALAGNGSDGKVGGAGGSIVNLFITRDENQLILTHNATINAGKGGDASRRAGGAGGVIDRVTLDKVDVANLSFNSGTQGDGGNSAFGVGGAGGFIRDVTVIDSDSGIGIEGLIDIRSGNGGDGSKGGGAGGSVIRTSVTAINANLQTYSGEGGDATLLGGGGAGGLLNAVQLSSEGVVANSFVSGTAVGGSGGDGMGKSGRGGIGGGARIVNINVVANTIRTDVSGGGSVTLTAGDGGSGQSNFYNSRGLLVPGGAPGRGGSVLVSGLFAEVGAASMIAGDAGVDGRGPALGGVIVGEGNNVKLVGLRALTSLYAKGGDGSHGGAGGGISNLSYGSTAASLSPTPAGDIIIQGGNGSVEGKVAGVGGTLNLIDGSVSSRPGSITALYGGDGGGVVPASLPVMEMVMGTGTDREVQIVDVGSLAGIAGARFTLGFGGGETGYISATRLNLSAIQAELNRVFPSGAPTASFDPLDPSQLKISFATTGDQPAIVATGYNGTAAARGGSIARVSVSLGGGQDVEFKAEAGDGGSAGPTGRTGGVGGSIGVMGIGNIDAATIVRSFGAGDGGDAGVFGGRGGSVVSVAVQDHDIGLRGGVAYGYTQAGGIFAGVGGHAGLPGGKDGKAGFVRDINANSIASIVAGKTLIPQMAEKVSQIYLNDDVQLVTRAGALVANSAFTLTFEGETTPLIPGNATNTQVETALNQLVAVQNTGSGGSGSVSVSSGPNGSYIVSFSANGDQVLLVGEEAVPVNVITTVPGQIVSVLTTEIAGGNVNLNTNATLEGEQNLPVVEAVSGAVSFVSTEQIRGDAFALPPVSEVQRLDLSTLISFPTGRVNLTFDDPASGTTGTTGLLGPNLTAGQVAQALNALPSISAVGGVTVQTVGLNLFNVSFTVPADQQSIVGSFFLPEKQQVFLGNIATTAGAQYTLTYDPGAAATSTTPPLDGNATLAQVDAALEALPAIQGLAGTAGDKVTVTSAQPGVLDITFNSIDQKNPFVATGFVQETQRVDLGLLAASPTGTFQLSYRGVLTAPISVGADADAVDAALEALSTIQALAGTVGDQVGVSKAANSNLLNVTFKSNGDKDLLSAIGAIPEVQILDVNALATTNGSEFTLTVSHNLNVTTTLDGQDGGAIPALVATQTQGQFNLSIPETRRGTAGLTEIQTINLGLVANQPAATFTLTFGFDTTVPLASNTTAATLSTTLNALQGVIDAGGLTVAGNVGGPFTVTFTAFGDQATFLGIGDVPEVQVVELANLRTTPGGQFTLTYGADTTASLDRNATPAQVDAALELLPSIQALNGPNLNKVAVVVGTGGREYQVTFNGIGDKDEMTIAAGGTADREVQILDLSPLASFGANSTFNLSFNGDVSAILPGDATAGNIDTVLEALPSIQALGPGNNVAVTTTATPGVFQIAFNTFGDQPLIGGTSMVGPSPTQIGTTIRLPGDATPAEVEAAIGAVSQTAVSVSAGTVAGTLAFMFNENGDQPDIRVTEYFHETQIIDVYAIGQMRLQFGLGTTALLAPNSTADQVDAELEGLASIQALGGPVGDQVEVTAGPNSSYVVLFHDDGNVASLRGSQFLGFTVGNEINGFNRDGSPTSKEQQILRHYNKRAFNADFFNTAAPNPFLPPPPPSGNLVGSISDIDELDANVFHYIRNNIVLSTLDGDFQPGDQPIDGLIMAKVLIQKTLNFTPEARYVLNSFFDHDNII